jgi:hypothetical protein
LSDAELRAATLGLRAIAKQLTKKARSAPRQLT